MSRAYVYVCSCYINSFFFFKDPPLIQKMFTLSERVMQYEDKNVIDKALSLIPLDLLNITLPVSYTHLLMLLPQPLLLLLLFQLLLPLLLLLLILLLPPPLLLVLLLIIIVTIWVRGPIILVTPITIKPEAVVQESVQ